MEYDCRYSKMHGMPVTGGRGFRGLNPLWYNGVPPYVGTPSGEKPWIPHARQHNVSGVLRALKFMFPPLVSL